MDQILFAIFTLAYIGLFIYGIALAKNKKGFSGIYFLLPVITGLIYDNGILAAGRLIGEGPLLKNLNYARFWMHAFFTPLLVPFAWIALKNAGFDWARKAWVKMFVILFTAALILLELFAEVLGLSLKSSWDYGVLSYESAGKQSGPPIMVLLVSAVLLAASILVRKKQKWPWFLAGSALMIAGSAVQLPVKSEAITNAFELILLVSLIATARFQLKQDRTSPHELNT